jgi:hypothetical protein
MMVAVFSVYFSDKQTAIFDKAAPLLPALFLRKNRLHKARMGYTAFHKNSRLACQA